MFEPDIKIQELTIANESFVVSIRVKCEYDPKVRSPKVAMLFENGEDTRRVPLLIEAYFPEDDLKKCIIFAKYTFSLKKIFFNKPYNEFIDCSFNIMYGDNYTEKVPFIFSRDVKLENQDYSIQILKKTNQIHIEPIELEVVQRKSILIVRVIRSFIRFVYSTITLILSVMLIPLFVLDAIVTALKCSKGNQRNKKHGIMWFLSHVRWRFASFYKHDIGVTKFKTSLLKKSYAFYSKFKVKKNRVTFLSVRREDMTGNFEFIFDKIKDDKSLDIRILLDTNNLKNMGIFHIIKFAFVCATSKVVLVDDFCPMLRYFELSEDTNLIQLWHACGAFKTFGFSRLGKKGGPTQKSSNHRYYDYAIVSSKEIAKFYAEGFGIADKKVVATGIPRTDIFFNVEYKNKVTEEFYQNYPQLRDKKIMLFAPTFRGNGKESAFYPTDKFNAVEVYDKTKGEYAILIKHHPFVNDRIEIPEEYKDVIIDMSDNSELNDLLFVSDLVVTDYSSVVFEAALLDIPMLFFAYDLRRYIATRDFYYEYETFVPGKVLTSEAQLITAVNEKDFKEEKINEFKTRFFDHLDGRSSERVCNLIYEIIKK